MRRHVPSGRRHAALIVCRPAVRSRNWSVSTAADGVAIVYFDSSAFVKLLVGGQGSALAVGARDTVLAVWDQRLQAGGKAAGLRTAPA